MLSDLRTRLERTRVAVIGDVILDEYIMGEVDRISPEAPVPVVRRLGVESMAGGAANVAANIAALGATPLLVGVVGDDDLAERLRGCLARQRVVDHTGLVVDPARGTSCKQRVVASRHQLMRIDREDTSALSPLVEAGLIECALRAIAASDLVVLSDYGKGVLGDRVLRDVIAAARAAGKRVVVDPKRAEFAAYNGASLLTPNRAELARATMMATDSDTDLAAAAAHAQTTFDGELLVTRSEKGMSYFPRDGAPRRLPTRAREVFDVSGAGDTVVAVLATILAAGGDMGEAMSLANQAAGLAVAKFGAATVSLDEILNVAATEAAAIGNPVERAHAVALARAWRSDGLVVGFTNGCFDLLHPGHISLIRQAAEACDKLVVALNTDASVSRLKGPSRPIQDEAARAAVVGAIKGVDLVVLFDEDTPRELIADLMPDVLVKGADYAIDQVVGADLVIARGGRVVLASLVPGHSTTGLVKRSTPA